MYLFFQLLFSTLKNLKFIPKKQIRNLSSHLSQEKRAIELSFIYLIDEPLYYSMVCYSQSITQK